MMNELDHINEKRFYKLYWWNTFWTATGAMTGMVALVIALIALFK